MCKNWAPMLFRRSDFRRSAVYRRQPTFPAKDWNSIWSVMTSAISLGRYCILPLPPSCCLLKHSPWQTMRGENATNGQSLQSLFPCRIKNRSLKSETVQEPSTKPSRRMNYLLPIFSISLLFGSVTTIVLSALTTLQLPCSGRRITLKQIRAHDGKQSIRSTSPGNSGVLISSSSSFYFSRRIFASGLWNCKKSPPKSISLPYRVGLE